MSLFQCEHCGCCENTALAMQGFKAIEDWFDWSGIEYRKGKMLCRACEALAAIDALGEVK